MNKTLIGLIRTLYSAKKFNDHTPEKSLITSRIKYMNKYERKEFDEEYNTLVNEWIIIREMKRTGKSSDCHIRLNIHKRNEIEDIIKTL